MTKGEIMKKYITKSFKISIAALFIAASSFFWSGSTDANSVVPATDVVSSGVDDLEKTRSELKDIAMLGQKPWYMPGEEPETDEERETRLHMIIDAIIDAASETVVDDNGNEWRWSKSDLAWAAWTKMYHESAHYKIEIHNGKIRGDHGKSVCLGQIMGGSEALVGTDYDSTKRCVQRVMSILAYHQNRCLYQSTGPSVRAVAKIYAGYGTGHSCDPKKWRAIRDTEGNILKDVNGEPRREYWALERANMWWRLRNGVHSTQKVVK